MASTSLLAALALAAPAPAADLVAGVEAAYAERGLTHVRFDSRAVLLPDEQERFLQDLLALVDEAVVLNANVLRWFTSRGDRGLHFEEYRALATGLAARIGALEAPARGVPARDRLARALELQQGFFADWHGALEAGDAFDSQIHSEFGFHAGLHEARRAILHAYGELRGALDGNIAAENAVRIHLRGLHL